MFSKYFEDIQKQLVKLYAKPAKKEAVEAPKGKKAVSKKDYEPIMSFLDNVTSSDINVCARKIADASGFRADTQEFVACRRIYKGVTDIFSDAVPAELAAASFHIIEEVNRKQLLDGLLRVANTKKTSHFGEEGSEPSFIPSFVIALKSTYSLEELKNAVMEIYEQDSVDPVFEFDIMMVLGSGLLIKNWRDNGRSYIGLETGEDTLKWFFVLFNEYIESKGKKDLDLRQYIREAKHYNEF